MHSTLLSKGAADALRDSRRRAEAAGNAQIEPEHLLAALLERYDSGARSLLAEARGDVEDIEREIARTLARRPRSRGAVSALPSPVLERALERAAHEARRAGAEQVGPDHLLLGLAGVGISDRATLLQRAGATADKLRPLVTRSPEAAYR